MGGADALEIGACDRSVILVKVPPTVAAAWRAACAAAPDADDGPVLGRLTPAAAAGGAATLTLEGAGVPASGATAFTARPAPPGAARVLAVGGEGGVGAAAPVAVGRVDARLDVAAAAWAPGAGGAAAAAAARSAAARRPAQAAPARTLQVIDDPRAGVLRRLPVAAVGVGPAGGVLKRKPPPPSRPRRGEFEKRARATKDEVEAALFRCFEARPAWTFAELHAATDQPAPWLREVLAGVAAPVRRPGTKDVWELKADYRVGGGR